VTTYLVRPSRPADALAVLQLAKRVGREFRVSQQLPLQPLPNGLEELSFVVETGRSEIVGSCLAREGAGGVWKLASLFLAADWRGFGLGRALVEEVLRGAQQLGALAMTCDLPIELGEASVLLERLGFVEQTGEDCEVRRFVRAFARWS
jgi:predicted N-acetyltransferase YhbS